MSRSSNSVIVRLCRLKQSIVDILKSAIISKLASQMSHKILSSFLCLMRFIFKAVGGRRSGVSIHRICCHFMPHPYLRAFTPPLRKNLHCCQYLSMRLCEDNKIMSYREEVDRKKARKLCGYIGVGIVNHCCALFCHLVVGTSLVAMLGEFHGCDSSCSALQGQLTSNQKLKKRLFVALVVPQNGSSHMTLL